MATLTRATTNEFTARRAARITATTLTYLLLIAGSILALIMRMRGIRLPRDRETWRNFTIQACLNSVLPFTLIAWAETSIDAGLAVILNSMTPVFTVLITLFWSRHEATSLRKFIGVVLGLPSVLVPLRLTNSANSTSTPAKMTVVVRVGVNSNSAPMNGTAPVETLATVAISAQP